MKIEILAISRNRRGLHIAEALREGFKRRNVRHTLRRHWDGVADCDAVIAYGWECKPAFETYAAAGKPFVCVDLGYWNRKPQGRQLAGHHKVAVNSRHPISSIGKGFPSNRFESMFVKVRRWRTTGEHILVAGTSARAVEDEGLAPQDWEKDAIRQLREVTDRPIIYRPKPTPTWKSPPPIEGAEYSHPKQDLSEVLRPAWAVVTRHSNVAIDGLVNGIPCYCQEGAASLVSIPSLADIESPDRTWDRMPFFYDLAYCQWMPSEMRRGLCWDWLQGELP